MRFDEMRPFKMVKMAFSFLKYSLSLKGSFSKEFNSLMTLQTVQVRR